MYIKHILPFHTVKYVLKIILLFDFHVCIVNLNKVFGNNTLF
jgi:hypothetical protein